MPDFKSTNNPFTGMLQKILDSAVLTTFRADILANTTAIEINTDVQMDNAMDIAALDAGVNLEMINGFKDVYEDETGVDTGASTHITYDGTGDYYTPEISGGIDAYTTLLLHMNGADESTTFTDDSNGGNTMTAHGNCQIDIAYYKFSTGSGKFDGAGDYISTAVSETNFDLGTADFTVDFWVRRDGNINDYGGIFSTSDTTTNGWAIYFGNAAQANYCKFAAASGGWSDKIVSDTILPDATWTHIEVVRYGNTLKMRQGGVEVASADVTGLDFTDGSNSPNIGRLFVTTDDYYFKGHIDELRISKGVARHTTDFTPESYPYTEEKYNMTLVSEKFSVDSEPSTARMLFKIEELTAITLDTDLMFDLSRNDDTNRTQGTPEYVRTIGSNKIIGVDFDLSGQPSGTDLVYRIRTTNNVDLYAKAVACQIK